MVKGLHMCAGLRGRSPRGESGAAAVEFALILPVLALLTFGIINFGWWFGQYLSLNQAVREGARRAVVDSAAGEDDIREWVIAAAGAMITEADDLLEVTPSGSPCTAVGNDLTVTATYTPKWIGPNIIPGLDTIFAPDIVATSVFRCEVP